MLALWRFVDFPPPFLKRLVRLTTCMVILVSFSSLLKVSAEDYADFLKDLGIGDYSRVNRC